MDKEVIKAALEAQLKVHFPNGHPDFIPLCLEEIELHSQKNADYAGGEGNDPLGNFNRVSDMLCEWGFDIPSWGVAWIYLMKQVDCVGNMIGQGYNGEVEGITKRLQDISVYAKLIQILYDEGQDTATRYGGYIVRKD